MSSPSVERHDRAPLASEEASDSEYEYEEIIEEVEEEEFVYEEVEVEEGEEGEEEEEEEEEEEKVEEEEEEYEEEPEEKDAGEEDETEAEQAEGGKGVQDDLMDLITKENDGDLLSCSFTTGTCQSIVLSNAHLEHDSSHPGTSQSNLLSQRLDEKLTTGIEDPKSSKFLEHQLSHKNCESRVPIEDKKDGEWQLKAENPCCSDAVLSNAHLEYDSSHPGTSQSYLPSQGLDEMLTTSNEDPKSSKFLEHQLSHENCESRVTIEDKKDGEWQLRAENSYCSATVLCNAHLEHDSTQPGASFSNLPSQRLDEKLTTSNEDPKSSKLLEHQCCTKNCESRVTIEDKKDGEWQLRAESPYCSDAVIKKNNNYLHNDDSINAETSNSSNLSGNKRTISKTLDDHPDADGNDALCSKEVQQKNMQCNEESKHMDPSLVDCGKASRSSTPVVELPERNKRAAIICNFFAKGWCVRGSSCRFVHLKDSVDSSDQPPQGIATSQCKKEDDNGEGKREDRVRLQTALDMAAASVGGKNEFHSSLSSEKTLPYSGAPVDYNLPKCENGFISRYGHAGRDRFSWSHHDDHRIHASSSNGVNSSVSGLNFLPRYEPLPDVSVMSLRINDNQGRSAYDAIKELKGAGQSQFYSSLSELPLRHSLNPSLYPSPFESCTTFYPNASHLGAHKRMKFTPYNWELSEPFRPSFSLASLGITIPGIQYYPFHDSIEKPSAGGASSFTKTSEEKISRDIEGNHIPGSENDGHSGTSLSRVNEQVVDRDSHGKDTCTVVAETAENSIVDCQNENVMLEESSRPIDLCQSKSDQVSLKKASKDDSVRNKIHHKGMHDSDGCVQHEPKSLKYFRSSLIELVKVLLRPVWHEGRVSKDEHNMIVKKAVDKVVSTVLLDEIPSTKEATKQYLSSSQPKIAKLVEGYVEKYGKS